VTDIAVKEIRIGDLGKLADPVFRSGTAFFALLVLVILGGVIVSLVDGALPALRGFGWSFLTTDSWNPVTEASTQRRRRIAAGSPASTPGSRPSPIPTTPIMKRSRNGLAITIQKPSTKHRSRNGLLASPTAAPRDRRPQNGDQLTVTV
jgi:hypothetical protein